MDPASQLFMAAPVAVSALVASTFASVAGFGGGVILLPILVWAFGVRDAVPILSVVQVISNFARAGFNRKELSLHVVGWLSVGAVPMSVLGAMLFASVPADLLKRLLGIFFLTMVVFRHMPVRPRVKVGMRGIVVAGAVCGFISGLLGLVGPLLAPFVLGYGLRKGAYVGTVAFASIVMQAVKVVVYGRYALLTPSSIAVGLAIGAVMILGAYTGKRILDRLPDRICNLLIEAMLIVSGVQFLVFG